MSAVSPTLEVRYESAAGLAADWNGQLKMGGLFAAVDAPEGLPAFAEVTLRIAVEGTDPVEVAARLTAASPGSLCLEVPPAALDALAGYVTRTCEALGVDGSTARSSARFVEERDTVPDLAPAPASDPPSERRHAVGGAMPLERKILAMSVHEKVQLALHGSREERALILRAERAGVVQASLVRNPRISLDEITALARSSLLAPDAAEVLAENRQWGSSPQVAAALARNPRTPLRTACDVLDKVNPADLRAIAKGLGVRMQVAQAARKRLFNE
jgi:hypothetical protein